MVNYLELEELLTKEEQLVRLPTFIRVEVKDEAEVQAKLPDYEPMFTGLAYRKQHHVHKHSADASQNKPCEVKFL
jgi:hypothetical protein